MDNQYTNCIWNPLLYRVTSEVWIVMIKKEWCWTLDKDMDFEEQWKEEFVKNYLDSIKQDKSGGRTLKAPTKILTTLKRKLKIW